jgi:ribonuclease HI
MIRPIPTADYDAATVWTDGSLDGSTGSCSIFSNSYQASYKIPPAIGLSSTTTELAGLVAAVYHHDPNTPLQIYTDSQAAIFLAKKDNPTSRTKLKNPNNDLVETLQVLASNHGAPISVHWIKGHSGDAGNEAADRLATAARRSNMTPAFPKLFTSIQFRPQCNGLPVNEYPRRFLRKQALLAHSRTFLWSRHGVNLKTLPSDLLKITASCLKNNAPDESPLFSSRHNSTFRAFRWKLVTDLLPIGSRHQRWGNQSNLAGVCRICNSATEDISHLFSCHSTDRTTWVDQLHSALISRVPSIPRQLSVSLLADGVLSHSYGTISEPMKTAILPFVVEDQPFAQLAAKILRGCHDFIFNSIWKPRCQATIDQERQLGITTQQKRVYESRPSAPSSNPYKFGLSRLLDRANWSSINLELTTI